MTMNGHYALYYITCLSFGAHHKNSGHNVHWLAISPQMLGRIGHPFNLCQAIT